MEGTIRSGEYRDVPYEIVRTESDKYNNGFKYEIVGSVRGREIITASELEKRNADFDKPWAKAIRKYLQAHIDGTLYAKNI